jgi:hypothetical protein
MRLITVSTLTALAFLPGLACGSEFTTIDCPGATTSVASSINTAGQIVGNCFVDGVYKGFLRTPNGQLHIFDLFNSQQTIPRDINESGQITGEYLNTIDGYAGFVISGNVASVFSIVGQTNGTLPVGINSSGSVAGLYADSKDVQHGFVRDPLGNITTFDAPNAKDTTPTAINDNGEITGTADSSGFVRDSEGNIAVFTYPSTHVIATVPSSINAGGEIVGWWVDSKNSAHGFTRDASGNFTTFDAPGASESSAGTFPESVNDAGEITGYAVNSANYYFGFTQSGPMMRRPRASWAARPNARASCWSR